MAHPILAALRRRFGKPPDLPSRREFLRRSIGAGTALLVSGPGLLAQPSKPAGKSVVIIGAGFAGLAAGYELLSIGYDVTIVEARERIGGRVLSFDKFVPGRYVEGGGELIGRNHPLWLAYADKFDLELLEIGDDDGVQPIVIDGKVLAESDAKRLWDELDAALRWMNDDAATVVEDAPWTTPGAAALDRRNMVDWLESIAVSALTKRALAALLTADAGVAPERQSYLGQLAQIKGGGLDRYWTDTEVFHCQGGNELLAHKLAAGIGLERIHLRLPARAVAIADGKVAVGCDDGRRLVADDVVVTVPPTVWDRIDFAPALPPAMAPQMGSNVKYLIHLSDRFWKQRGQSPDSLSDGDLQITWEATAGQPGDRPSAMVAFSGGPGAEAMRAIPAGQRDAAYLADLAQRYPTIGAAFVASRFMDWPAAEWTRGGYSFPAPGQVTTVGPLLHRGVGDKIHFAGEHTCYKFVGYMEGALDSGVSLARRLATRDGVIKG